MRAFEVYLNGKQLCLAGVGDDGVLSAIVNWVARKARGDLSLSVAGLVNPVSEHVKWVSQDVCVGDEIAVKIVETNSTDKPIKRNRTNPAANVRYQKSYVRAMAKKLGWKIQTQSKRSAS
jgi:hypothetical protein